jgi:hypothetical protein
MGVSFLNSNSAKEVVSVSLSPNEDSLTNKGIESWKDFANSLHDDNGEFFQIMLNDCYKYTYCSNQR